MREVIFRRKAILLPPSPWKCAYIKMNGGIWNKHFPLRYVFSSAYVIPQNMIANRKRELIKRKVSHHDILVSEIKNIGNPYRYPTARVRVRISGMFFLGEITLSNSWDSKVIYLIFSCGHNVMRNAQNISFIDSPSCWDFRNIREWNSTSTKRKVIWYS